ncbi:MULTISPECIES: ATP-dependent helicase [Arthrobacter]|uniref:DNA 3'-5' helicase n=1 Tax=Arthrobacter caoxuetaonis TaxID=2886935 RepID=A0A9X1SAK4_9MICC|nr:ATP-dependent DNA helicase [Arthrobacter caoxuetaonis]MCC3281023.1 ATP-dependent helicase [Arthrobacter caoxuetaonis]MCC3296725.1 ATP-dependent helicase [Arthrobacter caoxuetaonis]MCC9192815.1 ATP-dependent helicase [Arthrobacter sp. zg-Y916]USQ56454.1 ATP-dependent helicase [Arthrobacter caoxuetaonis]
MSVHVGEEVLGEQRKARSYSARQLAELLHGDSAEPVQYPTEAQEAIIEGPLEPLLVVAGAGSGKTKTMADRVVWLVANGLVEPEQILGVTFTRKAAGELASRIRGRLRLLHRVMGAAADAPEDSQLEPSVSTYHSYANGIVNDYGLRIGVERDSVMLGGAQSWQLANEVVEAYAGDYEHFTAAKSTLVGAVLQMASECSEHLCTPAQVRAELERHIAEVQALPYQAGKTKEPAQAATTLLGKLRTRVSVTELVESYQRAKAERRQLDFGDLVALAARIAEEIPEAVEMERAKYKVVLLDEFQDTSHAQMVLFSKLFGDGTPVTAVGDPHQSIYGFRGASAGQLGTFRTNFPKVLADGSRTPAAVANLSVAWRNSTSILATANSVSAPLNQGVPWLKHNRPLDVPELQAKPNARVGDVYLGRYLTEKTVQLPDGTVSLGEAEALAAQIAGLRTQWWKHPDHETDGRGNLLPPTVAVLCRGKKQFDPIRRALEAEGIPVQIVGLGGLLSTPEIVDLLAVLRVLGDPGRSDSMLRILAGARWRIGPADLMALADWSRHLVRVRERAVSVQDLADVDGPDESGAAVVETDLSEAGSLVEAVDYLPKPGWVSHAGRSLTAAGLARLGALRDELRELRGYVGEDLTTLIGEVERRILLDIEVAAKPGISIHESRRNLDAFVDAAATFSASADRVDLAAFLAWLEVADEEENGLPVTQLETSREAVQLLTVHASKGLEWDVVAVPGLSEGQFPNDKDSRWSSGNEAIPWNLRGDAPDLPQWDWEQPDQKSWVNAEKLFAEDARGHAEREERRLAYVAFTRARHVLFCSSSAWGGGRSKPTGASRYLLDLFELGKAGADGFHLLSWLEPGDEGDENPANALTERAAWPKDPLAPARRTSMEAAAAAVLAAADAGSPGPGLQDRAPGEDNAPLADDAGSVFPPGRWGKDVDLVLARHRAPDEVMQVELPAHISASMLVDLQDDPEAVTRQLRRPVPREPGMAARKGTAFHAWIEEYFGRSGMLDLDEYPGAADAYVDEAYQLEDMVATFEASEWAHRTPAFIEVPVETRVESVVVRGRIDAVFRDDDGGWDLIDWKTGAPPSADKLAVRSVQLAVYRLAWSRLQNVPLEKVRAAFYYVAADKLIRPHNLLDAAELEKIIASSAPGA